MTADDLERAIRALCKHKPFRPFLIEFPSSDRLLVSHPEAIDRVGEVGELFVYRGPDRGQRIFAGTAVGQLIDLPPSKTSGS